ncbi:MAG: hypothetical protein P0Y53_16565 [Candidatus Pseudobacter hemicellulosilyticus]|uniref:Uncharacterized protein n=1 Tax=Candidatus Pseudobacter hemicellulosilyticus TaxID=3121375 RepID=A0AAJ6BFB7_9BACT|nr:MAG: hypothetical protein P0Y53_16565 [Pseudobacter sp.]
MDNPTPGNTTQPAQNDNAPVDKPSWQQRFGKAYDGFSSSIWAPVCAGILGLILSVYLLLGYPCDSENRFHEINLNFNQAENQATSRLETYLRNVKKQDSISLDSVRNLKADPQEKEKNDELAVKFIERIDSISKIQQQLVIRRFNQLYRKADTLEASRLSVHPLVLEHIIDTAEATPTILFGYYEPEIATDTFSISNPITSREYSTSLAFFRKYPGFALWLFLGILQMVMWLVMVPVGFSTFSNIRDLHKEAGTTSRLPQSFIYSGIALGLFCMILYDGIIDEWVIRESFFMQGFACRLTIYAILGYIVAWLCLAGYLYLGDTLHQLHKKINSKAAELKQKKQAETILAGADEARLAAIDKLPALQLLSQQLQLLTEQHKKGKTFFNLFFGMATLVLSVLIFWVASMLQATNSLELFRYYKAVTGTDYLSNDFVYLYGGLHSILLAIFVLPVKFRIMEMNASFPDLSRPGEDTSTPGWQNLLKNIVSLISQLLVVSSPLLASFLQNMLSSFFQ